MLPVVRRHLGLVLAWYDDEVTALRRFRKHLRFVLQGYPVGHRAHARAGSIASATDVLTLLDALDPALTVVPSAVRAPRGRTDAMARLVLPAGWCDDPDAVPDVRAPAGLLDGG